MGLNRKKSLAIILRRTNFAEADRIINFITDDGKKVGIARGARHQGSKLAGGLEVFSLNEIVYSDGKSEMKTIISARMKEFFGNIVKDFERTEFGYSAIKTVSRKTEMFETYEFFEILLATFRSLNDFSTDLSLIRKWFTLNIELASGEDLNLEIDKNGDFLKADLRYDFDSFDRVFVPSESGIFNVNHIKFLRIMVTSKPEIVSKIIGWQKLLDEISPIIWAVEGR